MKKLILSTLFVSASLYAAGPIREITDGTEGKQVVSIVKDIEVKDMLEKTSEFNKCRGLYKFESGDDSKKRDEKISLAEKCFREQLKDSSGKADKLKELSEALNLQAYGLVQSKNIKDIQDYLSDKMYESMTGVNRKEADKKKLIDSMKFGKKKNIDQKTFLDLYKTQLGKNALYEVSRFCFENLRRVDGDKKTVTTFGDYWKDFKGKFTGALTDDGDPKFGTISDPTDKTKIYKDIFASIQGQNEMSPENLSAFFMECGKQISVLCKDFEDKAKTSEADTKSAVGTGVTPGASACLAKSRIKDYKQGLADAEKYAEEFDKMKSSPSGLQLLISGEPKIFGDGKDPNEATIDDLTNNTSVDILEGNYNKDQAALDKADECAQAPELAKCEGFVSEGDSLAKAQRDVDLEMTLKRDVEMERVKALKAQNDKSLIEYLTDNGYFDLLKDDAYKNMTADQLAEVIGKSYEAKRVATLAEINKRLGSRQVAKGGQIDKDETKKIVEESKEERARLAQVVLFNNIITSQLSLKKKDGNGGLTEAGRNINVIKKEKAALQGKIEDSYFQNIKTDGQGIGKDSQIAGFEILDQLLGKEEKK